MAKLLFSSGFEGNVSLAAPSGGWQDVVGQDSVTGASWPASLWGGKSSIQLLTGNGSSPSGVIQNSIDTVTGHDGGQTRALRLDVNQKVTAITQSDLLILPGTEPSDFYISEWIRLPADLPQRLGAGGWMTVTPEWKSAGDFRVVTNVEVTGSGVPVWHMKWDTNANGNVPLQTFWDQYNSSVPVPLGEWFHVEFFTHRGDTDGRVWLKVNGQTVFDHTGDNIGVNNARIDRIFLANAYANNPIEIEVDDIQIWDGVPTSGTSTPGTSTPAPAPAPAPTPAPSTTTATPVSITVGSGSDTLVLKISQDAWQGSAQYTISVDGRQIGGTLTASASHAAGQSDTVTVKGDWSVGIHTVSINFLNDAWGGTATTDRNLYVDGATYNGVAVSGAAFALYSQGPASFQVNDTTAVPGTTSAGKTITGGSGADTLTGTSGNDTINGGAGNDTISGGAGNDIIVGGRGNEKLTGGAGNDVFVFAKGDGFDWIADFTRGSDVLKMTGMTKADISWHTSTWPGVGTGLEVVYNNGANGGVFLPNVTTLGWSDFVFA